MLRQYKELKPAQQTLKLVKWN